MRSETYRTKLWNLNLTFCFIPVLVVMFGIHLIEGIRWINTPSQVNKCTGETANLTWEYVSEANHEIRQLQWRFNTTTLIAYRSVRNGLHVDPEYEGRIEKSGDAGILLKNISSKDTGSYTLYPVIAWEESTITQSIWLNVIEEKIQQWCTCERLPISPDWSLGQTVNVVTDGCSLEINSSFCCIKGPAIKCMETDSQKLCVPIRYPINRTENATQSRSANDLTEHATRNSNVPEHTAPTPLQVGNTALAIVNAYLPLLNTLMLGFLCACGVIWMVGKIRQEQDHRWRIQTKSDLLGLTQDYSFDAFESNSIVHAEYVKCLEGPYEMESEMNT